MPSVPLGEWNVPTRTPADGKMGRVVRFVDTSVSDEDVGRRRTQLDIDFAFTTREGTIMMMPQRVLTTPAFPTTMWSRLLAGLAVLGGLLAPASLFAQQAADPQVSTEGGAKQTEMPTTAARDSADTNADGRRTAPSDDPDALTVYTSDGSGKLRFKSADGDFKGRFGGRIMFDQTVGSVDDALVSTIGPMEDGTEFRRARLFTEGSLYDIGYKFQIDFAGDPDIKSMYLEFPSPVPNSGIKVGKFKEDLSLVERTSSKYITFMARPILTEFAGGRDVGIRLGGGAAGGSLNYGIGFYRDKVDDALGTSQGDGDYKGTGRVAYVPWRTDDNRKLVHVGASGSVASLDPREVSEESHEPEVHLAPDFVQVRNLAAEQTVRVGGESALVYNSFSVQAEYLQKGYRLETGNSDPTFDAWYVSGSYFLTGEHRPYDGGSFDRVTPNENVRPGEKGGLGAWEVAARYSTMSLTDSDFVGGEVDNITLGINWYLNPSVRIMANYVFADVEDPKTNTGVDGRGHFFSTRFQLDF